MAAWTSMARNLFGSDRTVAPVPARDGSLHPTQRRWSVAEKMRIVSESFAPGASTTSVAARHGVSRVALTRWRAQTMRGDLGALPRTAALPAVVPVVMDEASPEPSETIVDEVLPDRSVSVTIEGGGVVVRLPGDSSVDRIVAVASGLRLAP